VFHERIGVSVGNHPNAGRVLSHPRSHPFKQTPNRLCIFPHVPLGSRYLESGGAQRRLRERMNPSHGPDDCIGMVLGYGITERTRNPMEG
jgi:hypothetical protein